MSEPIPILSSIDEAPPAEATPHDPYDGVPLGVECAWPSQAAS